MANIKHLNLILLFLLITSIAFAQLRSDFIISDSTFSSDMSTDSDGTIHTLEWNERGVYYGKYDSIGYLIENRITILDSPWSIPKDLIVSDDHILFLWPRITPAYNYIEGKLLYRNIDSLGSVIDVDANSNCFHPKGCFTSDTSFVVIWFTDYKLNGKIYSIHSNNPIKVFQIIENLNPEFRSSGIVVLNMPSQKQFLTLWQYHTSDINNIYGRLMNYDGSKADSVFSVINEPSEIDPWFFDAKILQDNNIVIFWTAKLDSIWNIYWRLIDSNGSLLNNSQTVSNLKAPPIEYSTIKLEVLKSGDVVLFYEGESKSKKVNIYGVKFDKNLTAISEDAGLTSLPDSSNHYLSCTDTRANNLYALWYTGESYTTWAGIYNFELLSISPLDHIDRIAITPILYQNYPNPFNSETIFKYRIFEESFVTLNLYNVLGQKIKEIISGETNPGIYIVKMDASNLPSGVYFYSLETDNFQITKKCLFLK